MLTKQALKTATTDLTSSSNSPALDAEVLLNFVLEISRERLYNQTDREITNEQLVNFEKLVARRQKHEPIAYIIGRKEFFGLDFYVNKRVLIPRPDTETLVEEVIENYNDVSQPKTIADIGTGSGCISVALAKNLPAAQIFVTDISKEALAVARKNIEKHKVNKQVESLHGDLLDPLSQKVDFIVSNPPYLAEKRVESIKPDVINYEPRQALLAGSDGLDCYEKLLATAGNHLKPSGIIFLEIDPLVAENVTKIAQKYFPNADLQIKKDLAQKKRVLIIRT